MSTRKLFPTCTYKYCGALCGSSGFYCFKHAKHVSNTHTCSFIYGSKSGSKQGTVCGCRISRQEPSLNSYDIDKEDVKFGQYLDSYLCKRHTTYVAKKIIKQQELYIVEANINLDPFFPSVLTNIILNQYIIKVYRK